MRRTLIAALLAGLAGPALAAMPPTLVCTQTAWVNWLGESFHLPEPGRELHTGVVIHLRPSDGEWYLEYPGAAVSFSDNGRLDIVRDAGEWVGIGSARRGQVVTLRILTERPQGMAFLFASTGYGLVAGTCAEPEEPFLMLTRPAPQ